MKPPGKIRKEGGRPSEEYVRLAADTGFFRDAELKVLEEVILDYQKDPGKDYFFLEEADESGSAGFIIFGRTPLTDQTWDIYWIAVRKNSQGKGVGRKLLSRAEAFILLAGPTALLRIETSGKKEYDVTQEFYKKTGFLEAGRIPDFYSEGDALINYYKRIGPSGKGLA